MPLSTMGIHVSNSAVAATVWVLLLLPLFGCCLGKEGVCSAHYPRGMVWPRDIYCAWLLCVAEQATQRPGIPVAKGWKGAWRPRRSSDLPSTLLDVVDIPL